MLFVAGDKDNVSGYENGTRLIFEEATNADRYLLTFANARHNVAPTRPRRSTARVEFSHSPSGGTAPGATILCSTVTAFLGIHLKDADYGKYLDVEPAVANESTEELFWAGFPSADSLLGLTMEHRAPGE